VLLSFLGLNPDSGLLNVVDVEDRLRVAQMIPLMGPMLDELYDRGHEKFRSLGILLGGP
jgi:hypothetical protein